MKKPYIKIGSLYQRVGHYYECRKMIVLVLDNGAKFSNNRENFVWKVKTINFASICTKVYDLHKKDSWKLLFKPK